MKLYLLRHGDAVETGMGAFQKALQEGLGPMGDKLMRDLAAFSTSGHNELRHRRWDLSVNAPSSAADLLKTVAQTRWIRTLTLNMKPGRNPQYIEAWKGFMAELRSPGWQPLPANPQVRIKLLERDGVYYLLARSRERQRKAARLFRRGIEAAFHSTCGRAERGS
jgi:hypothetical protein